MGVLLVFEICTLFGLAGLDRWTWSGAWGFAGAMALHSSLGDTGSWITGGALLALTALAASEMGFHWIGHMAHGLVLNPARGIAGGIAGLWTGWRERRAEAERLAAKKAPRDAPAKKPNAAAVAD